MNNDNIFFKTIKSQTSKRFIHKTYRHTQKSVNHYHQHWIEKLAWPETKTKL